jgi:hypothetical protein
MTSQDVRDDVSLVCANFGNGDVFGTILGDWFDFLGGKPGEVVVVDGGSDRRTQDVCWELFHEGRIDKLQLIRSDHPENSKSRCYVQEYQVAAIAGRPYLLFVKIDTLPFRTGNEQWLAEAVSYLDRPEVFAVSGAFNWDCKDRDAWPGWYYSRSCTENFALMKRDRFVAAMEEYAGDFIRAGFHGPNPAGEEGKNGRFLIESGFSGFMKKHDLFSLVREDDHEWTILHTNLRGEDLMAWREKFYRREGVEACVRRQRRSPYPYGIYYGHSTFSMWKRHARIALGASPLGGLMRGIRRLVQQ